jgi:alpha-glucosidase
VLRAAILAGLLLALPATAEAADRLTVRAPTGSLRATFDLQDGVPRLAVARGSRVLLAPAPLGLRTAAGDLTRGLRLVARSPARRLAQRYRTIVGKRRAHRDVATRRVLRLAGAGGERLELELHVAGDGVGYRYRLPARRLHRVLGEASSWTLPPQARTWTQSYTPDDPSGRKRGAAAVFYESPIVAGSAGTLTGRYVYPLLAALPGGERVLFTEADLDGDYAGTHLRATGDGVLAVSLPMPDGRVASRGPLTTPWRVAVVGDLATVVESDLVQDLAPPSRIRDTSWIAPGPVAWSWNADIESPRSYARQREQVDYAAGNGRRHVLVDEGWSPRWMPALVRYAKSRGVGVWLWSPYTDLRTAAQRASRLGRWKDWGIAGAKIDFTLCDCQARQRWFAVVIEAAARRRLMLNFHGSTVPRGVERTWPNVLSVEAVWGGEIYNAFLRLGIDAVPQQPAALTMLPFTRNVVGPMDFTPVLFTPRNRLTSDGFELGTAVVFESGLQHWSDSLAAYRSRPAVERVLSRVPTTWDETRLLAGAPGTGAVIARRRGAQWWVGAISATPARRVRVSASFLGAGSWRARTTADADATGRGLTESSATLTRRGTITVDLAANGGFVTRLSRSR